MNLHCVLDLKTANQPFHVTLQLIMMPQHTKFGNKRFSDSEGIVQKNIH